VIDGRREAEAAIRRAFAKAAEDLKPIGDAYRAALLQGLSGFRDSLEGAGWRVDEEGFWRAPEEEPHGR